MEGKVSMQMCRAKSLPGQARESLLVQSLCEEDSWHQKSIGAKYVEVLGDVIAHLDFPPFLKSRKREI